jgi:hypothetical protein
MNARNPGSNDLRSDIALRAYFIWERSGRPEGRQHDHWALAEAEILSEQRTKKAADKKPAEAVRKIAKEPAAKKTDTAKASGQPTETTPAEKRKAAAPAKKSGNGASLAASAPKAKKTIKPKAGKSLPRE